MIRLGCGLASGFLALGLGAVLAVDAANEREAEMGNRVEGGFEITGWEETDLVKDGVRIYRTEVTKAFTGGIEGTSRAWLVMTVTPGESRAYSGYELLDVTIGERKGKFVLDHHASMDAEGQQAEWHIVPESGTGDLEGITGTAEIARADDGTHTITLQLE